MTVRSDWDWEPGKREVADLGGLAEQYAQVHEFAVSEDGERIAVPVKRFQNGLTVIVNGSEWEGSWEKLWNARFAGDGRLTALGMNEDSWRVVIEGADWEEGFEYVWNPRISADGEHLGVQVKRDFEYSAQKDGVSWEESFHSSRELEVSSDGGRMAMLVQVAPLAEGDIDEFRRGTWSVAVDGRAWGRKFMNVWGIVFSDDGEHVATQARTDTCEFTYVVDDTPWPRGFTSIWLPLFRPGTSSLVGPAKMPDGWSLVENGEPLWKGRYSQLWDLRFSPDAKRIGAVVATDLGKWTLAIDDVPWETTVKDLVLGPFFSADSAHAACVVKNENRWTCAVDDRTWEPDFDMVWNPELSADGSIVVAKAERDRTFHVVVNGRVWNHGFEALWEPRLSADGEKVLLRGVEGGKYYRWVLKVGEITG